MHSCKLGIYVCLWMSSYMWVCMNGHMLSIYVCMLISYACIVVSSIYMYVCA